MGAEPHPAPTLLAPTPVTGLPEGTSPPSSNVQRNSLLLTLSSLAVGLGNYGFSLTLVWLLPGPQFSQVASASALLLVVGTVSGALLPLLVARTVARHPEGSRERSEAVGFSLAAALVLGLASAVVAVGLAAPYAPSGILALLGVTCVALFVASVGAGYLLGTERFHGLAVWSIVETVVKLGAGSALAAAGAGATGAFAGSAAGAVVWAAGGLWIVRHEVGHPGRSVPGGGVRLLVGTGGVQAMVTALTTLDVIVGSIVLGAAHHLGGYQAMLVFARVPLFVSNAVGGAVYARLSSQERGRAHTASEAARVFLGLSMVIAAAVATLPSRLVVAVLPGGYAHSTDLLLPLAIAGFAGATLNLTTTFMQADARFLATARLLLVALAGSAGLYVALGRSDRALAWSAAAAMAVVALAHLRLAGERFGPARLATAVLLAAFGFGVLGAALHLLSSVPAAWVVAVLAVAAGAVLGTRPRVRPDGPLRILVVGRPGPDPALALVRELLTGVDGEVVAEWHGRNLARSVWLLHRHRPDLMVEELSAPYATAAARWWHGGAAVGVVVEPPGVSRGHRALRSYEGLLAVHAGAEDLRRLSVQPGAGAATPEVVRATCAAALEERGGPPLRPLGAVGP